MNNYEEQVVVQNDKEGIKTSTVLMVLGIIIIIVSIVILIIGNNKNQNQPINNGQNQTQNK